MKAVHIVTAAAVATLAAALSPRAKAAPVTFEVIESFFADWHWSLEDPRLDEADRDHVVDLRNRLNLRLRTGEWAFGLRLDAALFVGPPSSQYASDIRPEEVFVTWKNPTWTLTLGDDYLTVGRGIALSLRKFDEIGFATGLRGIHAQWRPVDAFKMRIGAGFTNTVNVDLVEEKLVPDPNDLVLVARTDVEVASGVTLGAHVVDIERRHSDARSTLTGALFADGDTDPIQGHRYLRSWVVGGNVDVQRIADVLDLYAEFDWLNHDETRTTLQGEADSGTTGTALYASATAALGSVNVLLEGKRYDHYKLESTLHPDTADQQAITHVFPYMAAPTLERVDQRVVNNTDVTGVHARVDVTLPRAKKADPESATTSRAGAAHNALFVSAAYFADAPLEHEWTFHTYLGWERTTASGQRLQLQAGYRQEEAPREGLTRLRMFHLDLDWASVLAPGVDLQLHWKNEVRAKNVGGGLLAEDYIEGAFYLSVNLPPHWSFTAQCDYLTDDSTDPLFPGGFVQFRWNTDSFVRVFVGRSKGGLKCAGGVCRVFPNFEGVKPESTIRF